MVTPCHSVSGTPDLGVDSMLRFNLSIGRCPSHEKFVGARASRDVGEKFVGAREKCDCA